MLETNKIYQGDCIEELKKLPDNSIDAIITDPPYGLEFMGKDWDKFKNAENIGGGTMENRNTPYQRGEKTPPAYYIWTLEQKNEFQIFSMNWAKECLRVLKPGGFLLSFGGTRTYHRMTCGIEDAGFEIRDCIMWIYGSGFPKSLNIGKAVDKIQGNDREVSGKYVAPDGKERGGMPNNLMDIANNQEGDRKEHEITKGTSQWEGWGTALKPACEPIVVARKPLSEKNVALNVLKWGTGGINIDESRIDVNMDLEGSNAKRIDKTYRGTSAIWNNADSPTTFDGYSKGRFPANLILDEEAGQMLDEQTGNVGNGHWSKTKVTGFGEFGNGKSEYFGVGEKDKFKGGASRFFYCAKASKSERNNGTNSFINIEVFNIKCENKQEERSLIQGERLVKLSVDMETLQIKDIEESGIKKKEDLGWNTIWFGKNIMEKYSQDFQSIIKMKTNSTMLLKTWNWLIHLLTKEYILDVNLSMENGGNLAENVDKSKELIITMNEKLELALGVKNVVSGMQLKIKLSEGKCDHPTVKPIKLMEYLIKLVSKENAVILDPFLGSGTTAIACLKTNRKFIGIEKESDYVKIAEARIKPYLSQQKLI